MTDFTVLVNGDLNHELLGQFWNAMENHGPAVTARIHLCTPGGDFAVWTALIDLLSPWREAGELVTVAMGEVCSGGVPVLASGTPGRRGMYRHAMLGLHEPYLSETTPDPAVLGAEIKSLESMKSRFHNLLAEHTNHRACWWRRRLSGQSLIWIDAKEAVRWGLVDKILG